MSTLQVFVESNPAIAALLIATLFSSAILFDLVFFRSRAFAGLSAALGFLGLFGCISIALQKDSLAITDRKSVV